MPRTRYIDDADRIRRNVEISPDTGCWNWQLHINDKGYGRLNIRGQMWRAHRLAYEAFVGPVPEDLQLDHLCRNRGCVNPEHLEPVTGAENLRRAESTQKNSCRRNHPFDEQNTYVSPDGRRYCRACGRERSRAYAQRQALRAAGIAVTP